MSEECRSLWCFFKMEIVYLEKTGNARRFKKELEKKLNVNLEIIGRRVNIEGEPLDEFGALKVFEAINFGFSVGKALMLVNDEVIFKKIHIRNFTRRNLKDIRARLIGTNGKTRKTISEITGCEILIKEGEVGIIGDAERVDDVERAIIHLIKGAKQGNMYKFLERMNRERKKNFTEF